MPATEPRPGRLRATFMRGGTSKGLMVLDEDAPADARARDSLFAAAMGSPDPYGRQLNGMGGGVSSLSKVCIVGPPSRPDADVDYTFGQVLVNEARVDYAGNCGNMSSAVGPFAVMRGIVKPPGDGYCSIVIHNTNTGKLIRSTFAMAGGEPRLEGLMQIDGVSGSGAPIRLDFLDPGGSKTGKLLPTGQAQDILTATGAEIRATIIDAASPCVFVDAADFGMSEPAAPEVIERDAGLMERLERLRCEASVRAGLAKDLGAAAYLGSVPRIALVFAAQRQADLSGRVLDGDAMDITVRMVSMGKPHRALPMRIEGATPHRLARHREGALTIAHPSGLIQVDASVIRDAGGMVNVKYGAVYRTARILFDGYVFS